MTDAWEEPLTEVEQEAMARYKAALHGMQTGVAYEMSALKRHPETEPKHLRVGVNSAMVDTSTMVRLLIRKGVITREEYLTTLAEGMEEELAKYHARAPKGVTFL